VLFRATCWNRVALYCFTCLQVTRELHPEVLRSWAPLAGVILEAARVEQVWTCLALTLAMCPLPPWM
jgi:hypothetical protein